MNNSTNSSPEEKEWPLGGAERREERNDNWLSAFSQRLHSLLVKGVSNLRLSLTLRIALHYAGQLLRTTLPMAAVLLCVLFVFCYLPVEQELDALSQVVPQQGTAYSQSQLAGTSFTEAIVSPAPVENVSQRISLAFSSFRNQDDYQIWLAVNTTRGSVRAAWQVDRVLELLSVAFWTFVCIELFRVVCFLRQKNRLNRKVLKPITDMAEQAANLSANNLSDRLSVEGAKNELKDLALVINGMLDRIEVSYNSQKQFVSDASHELRTPIAVIQGYVNMLQRWGKTDEEVLEEGITAISQEAASMKELVERLLFLARHDKKTLMLEMETFDPLEVMSEIHREAKLLSSEHCFRLEPAQNARIHGDKDMIKQLMRILLDNAIKYTPAGGSVTLGVKREGRNCILSVSDTGAGIAAEELPKVFDRFYRCEETRQTSGHGLGLSIARIIVSAHGGKLKVRSKVGVGTTFSVLLPLEPD